MADSFLVNIVQKYTQINNLIPNIENKYRTSRCFTKTTDTVQLKDNLCCFIYTEDDSQEVQGENE